MSATPPGDVRSATQEVGALLGQIIREEDPAAFARIEAVRRLAGPATSRARPGSCRRCSTV